jgi:hypothetical protein
MRRFWQTSWKVRRYPTRACAGHSVTTKAEMPVLNIQPLRCNHDRSRFDDGTGNLNYRFRPFFDRPLQLVIVLAGLIGVSISGERSASKPGAALSRICLPGNVNAGRDEEALCAVRARL